MAECSRRSTLTIECCRRDQLEDIIVRGCEPEPIVG